jgi:GH15 family glucan-1,4-alpha-glucosidase
MFVGLDENGLVHDFYYPYVGLENLTNARSSQHKIGVWVDGKFKWVDDGSWKVEVDFEADALISDIRLKSDQLQVSLHLQDFIDTEHNSLIRHITVANEADKEREVRLFMHQVFQISRMGRGDTALFVPDANYILDYKGRYSLLISGRWADGADFDQYAVGIYGIEDKKGTFLDAEDGELSGNAVEHGGVDSVLRFSKKLPAREEAGLDYWIVAASSQQDAEKVHDKYKQEDTVDRLRTVRQNWQDWLSNTRIPYPDENKRSLQHSLLIIKAHCDDRGSVLASGDSSIFNYGRDYYCYCWPRDAAYALWPLIRLGHFDEARQFFEFARDTMHPDGYLMHKYQPDRAIGSTWHPLVHGRNRELAVQEDETASVVFMIGEYLEANPEDRTFVEHLFQTLITPCANWMCDYVDEQTGLPHASSDLWEEKFLTTTYTVCATIAGLEAAAKLANEFDRPEEASKWNKAAAGLRDNLDALYHPQGYFRKGFLLQEDGTLKYDDTIDISSLYGPFMYAGLHLDDERLQGTLRHVEDTLFNKSPQGGVIRYEFDNYFLSKRQFKGNPWLVCTLWLAQFYAIAKETDKAQALLDVAIKHELRSGALSEQFDPENGEPLGVTPLVWSHAELVNTILDLSRPSA